MIGWSVGHVYISALIRRSDDSERMAESMDPQNSKISLGFPMVFAELELGMAEVVFLFFGGGILYSDYINLCKWKF